MPILPVALVLFMIFGTISQPLFAKVQQKLSTLNTVLQENLAGIKVIKAFTREREQQKKFRVAADDTMNQAITVSRLFTFLFPLVFLIANLGQAAILYVGGKQIILGTLSIGEWQEFSLYLMYLFFPIAQLGFIITQLGQASTSADRIFEILDAKSDIVDKPNAITLPAVKGDVKFDNVTFRYFGGGEPEQHRRSARSQREDDQHPQGASDGQAQRREQCRPDQTEHAQRTRLIPRARGCAACSART